MSTYVSDKLRNLVTLLVLHYGLDPAKAVDAWSQWVDHAARTWLESGHLREIIVEFYIPSSTVAAARWDFPIHYDGVAEEDMWVDRKFFENSFAKAKEPPAGCTYRIVLMAAKGRPHVAGLSTATLRSIEGLTAREAGTIVATPDITASAKYYR